MHIASISFGNFFADPKINAAWSDLLSSEQQSSNYGLVVQKAIDYHLMDFKKPKEESVKAFEVLNNALKYPTFCGKHFLENKSTDHDK